MTAVNLAANRFAKHFDHQKRTALAGIDALSSFFARFAQVSSARSERTKQLNIVSSVDFEQRILSIDPVRTLTKEMQREAKVIGLAAEAPEQTATAAARHETATALKCLLEAWRAHDAQRASKSDNWTAEHSTQMLDEAVALLGAVRTAFTTLRTAIINLRVALTKHLRSKKFRDLHAAPSDEFRKLAELVANEVHETPVARPPKRAAREASDDECEAGAQDLGDDDTVNTDQEEAGEEADLSSVGSFVVVDDNHPSESQSGTSESSAETESSDETSESASEAPPPRVLRKRTAEQIEAIIEQEKAQRAYRMQHKRRVAASARWKDASDDEADNAEPDVEDNSATESSFSPTENRASASDDKDGSSDETGEPDADAVEPAATSSAPVRNGTSHTASTADAPEPSDAAPSESAPAWMAWI